MNFKMYFLCLLAGMIFCMPSISSAEDSNTNDRGVVHNGVVFNVAQDRKIELIGGVYQPEGVDKYIERKLSDTNARIDKLEERLVETNKKLDEILKEILKAISEASPSKTASLQ